MPKRRAGVNNIIFELDEHDSDSVSDGEVVEVKSAKSKRGRGAAVRDAAQRLASIKKALAATDADCVEVIDLDTSDLESVGGKANKASENKNTHNSTSNEEVDSSQDTQNNSDLPDPNVSANVLDCVESDDDEGLVAGCENKVPLVTVRFRDRHLAKRHKAELEQFLLSMLSSLPGNEEIEDSLIEKDSDLELHIWPEDLEKGNSNQEPDTASNLFFVDTNPDENKIRPIDIPKYSQSSELEKEDIAVSSPKVTRSQCCFNCDGDHLLHQCPVPKNYARIAQARKAMAVNNVKMGRYHVEDEQKYGHIIPGRISGRLRHALGLKRDELPLHIYRMRLLGYPPGWLQEARIQHSGIAMFDSEGKPMQDPEEEDGELCAPGSKDKFDIKKIMDYPGFNVAPSSRYVDAAHKYGLPTMSERDSKMMMLTTLAPNAMQAYKRKKLTLFSAADGDSSILAGSQDMDIGSDEEAAVDFPLVPPLPDEAPPPAPPPPAEPPRPPEPPADDVSQTETETSQENDDKQKSQSSSGKSSPSLTDLEEHKRMLLEALHSSGTSDMQEENSQSETENKTPKQKTPTSNKSTPKTGQVKHSDFGTPVVNLASAYVKLPSDDKFAKDICDVINFENLPDSTGAYKKMSALLRKVKDEVTKIQDS